MDALVDELADHLVQLLKGKPSNERVLIGVAGIPASGKSVLAAAVVARVNRQLAAGRPDVGANGDSNIAIMVGMDGWHYSRAELDKFDNVKEAYDRRGAAFTFNAQAFVDFVALLRAPISDAPQVTMDSKAATTAPPTNVLSAPSFSHSLKDPTEGAIKILPTHRIVVLEGLYLQLDVDPWRRAGLSFDERWFVSIDRSEARERLRLRHVETGVARDEAEALWRADNNDLPNGDYILTNLLPPTRTLKTVKDSGFVKLVS